MTNFLGTNINWREVWQTLHCKLPSVTVKRRLWKTNQSIIYQPSTHQRRPVNHYYQYNVISFIYKFSISVPHFKCIKCGMKRIHKDVHISVLVQEKLNEISWEYTVPNTTDEDMNHGIVFTLKSLTTSWFRSVVQTSWKHTQKQYLHCLKSKSPSHRCLFFLLVFFYKETIAVRDFFFLIRHESRQWPPFQLTGSRRSSRLLKCRKALVTVLGSSPVCHKMSPDTKPSHSYQCTPTALPTNVTSFFPPTAKVKQKKKP